MRSWPDTLTSLVDGRALDRPHARWAMEQILSGSLDDVHIAAFLVALRAKGVSLDELVGLVDTMIDFSIKLPVDGRVVDIVGTGGDRAHTVNISTMSAMVIAGAGVPVVKHGNRASSSSTGSADVLEALGVRLDVPTDRLLDVLAAAGLTFCFAPVFHASLRHAAAARRELAIPTVFNFLGPLTNPAHPAAMAVGCADEQMAPLMAGVLAERGTEAFVFRGEDGLDEITVTGPTKIWSVRGGQVEKSIFDPADIGIDYAPQEALRGGDKEFNADVVRRILTGERSPVRDAVLLNAGAALAAHEATEGTVTDRIAAGVTRAADSIDSGAANSTLQRWIDATTAVTN